jgi:hypothetical protein
MMMMGNRRELRIDNVNMDIWGEENGGMGECGGMRGRVIGE